MSFFGGWLGQKIKMFKNYTLSDQWMEEIPFFRWFFSSWRDITWARLHGCSSLKRDKDFAISLERVLANFILLISSKFKVSLWNCRIFCKLLILSNLSKKFSKYWTPERKKSWQTRVNFPKFIMQIQSFTLNLHSFAKNQLTQVQLQGKWDF